ncbi:molybdopterin synthase catalytic subunit MoaE [Vreelandella alkaliphila]|uniref:molybdopterin synthase catalytic subunit MoaE n=1 Tax=Vreelandella alkaliphila TaxID=272774 RepID=UPI003F9479AB
MADITETELDIAVRVQEAAFKMDDGYESALRKRTDIGAIVTFTGFVRDFNESPDVIGLTLEHYPGMTERTLTQIGEQAGQRWALQAVRIIHRIGDLTPGDPIVRVLVASAHRRDAFQACDFIMDLLKTQAPFWKKEHSRQGAYWVKERHTDQQAAERW